MYHKKDTSKRRYLRDVSKVNRISPDTDESSDSSYVGEDSSYSDSSASEAMSDSDYEEGSSSSSDSPFSGCIGLCGRLNHPGDCDPAKKKKKKTKNAKPSNMSAKKKKQQEKRKKRQKRADEQRKKGEVLDQDNFLDADGTVHTHLQPEVLETNEVSKYFRFQNLPSDIFTHSALDIMLLFIPMTLWRRVVKEKNLHFQNNRPGGQVEKRWKDVTLKEIIIWHGLLLAMTLQKNPSDYARYWDKETRDTYANEAVRRTDYGRFMKQYRWGDIKIFMQFNDNTQDVARDHEDHDPPSFDVWTKG